ncbi:MAG: ATP-dependent helicase HrpA [Polyangiaceae bacterium]
MSLRARGSARIDWAELLKRVYDIDALACACGGRLQFIALIIDEESARSILASLKLPTQAPPLARARSPDWIETVPSFD